METKIQKVIKTGHAYNEAVDRAIEIFDAEPGSNEFDELEVLVLLIKDYEDKHHPVVPPDPIQAIKAKMHDKGLKNKDMIPYIGSEGYVSAILRGNRQLTLTMAKNINLALGIPAEILLGNAK